MLDTNSWLLIAVLVFLFWTWPKRENKLPLQRLEKKLDAILKHLDIDLYPGVDAQILELACAGKKIEAIKLYREKTGVGLKEAKDFIDGL